MHVPFIFTAIEQKSRDYYVINHCMNVQADVDLMFYRCGTVVYKKFTLGIAFEPLNRPIGHLD